MTNKEKALALNNIVITAENYNRSKRNINAIEFAAKMALISSMGYNIEADYNAEDKILAVRLDGVQVTVPKNTFSN